VDGKRSRNQSAGTEHPKLFMKLKEMKGGKKNVKRIK